MPTHSLNAYHYVALIMTFIENNNFFNEKYLINLNYYKPTPSIMALFCSRLMFNEIN